MTPVENSRFHVSLNVSDLARSVQFFELLFGKAPAKRKSDYAKFEVDDPPTVLSLEHRAGSTIPRGGALNHAGIRVANSSALVDIQRRLEEGGVKTIREDGVECCYAKQTKFWANDPDGTMWEVYVLEDDALEHRGKGIVPLAVTDAKCCE
jgi:catechol 2,3-dioxygenase-like lactoylglutathione lyase family enzyme